MKTYAEIKNEVNDICRQFPGCWHTPAASCPYWPVCSAFKDEDYATAEQRGAAFENAIAARYDQLHC
nr:MAG TPA: hypothetical protein [Caudoviricetes sp.]